MAAHSALAAHPALAALADPKHKHGQASIWGSEELLLPTGLAFPQGVAVDQDGNIYVTDGDHPFKVYELPHGVAAYHALPFVGLHIPWGVAVDAQGDVFVTDASTGELVELRHGAKRSVIVDRFRTSSLLGLAIAPDGDLYAVDAANSVVYRRTPDGALQRLPTKGLNLPVGVAVNAEGEVVVANAGGNDVLALKAGSKSWSPVNFGALDDPFGVAIDSRGDIFVANTKKAEILERSVATGRITKLPFTDLDRPYSVVVDRHGDVIISDPSDTWVLELPRL